MLLFWTGMVKAENNHEMRQLSSDIGRPDMTILGAALFPEELDSSASKAGQPRRKVIRSLFATWLRRLRNLALGWRGGKR
jgi:hypothetical protein